MASIRSSSAHGQLGLPLALPHQERPRPRRETMDGPIADLFQKHIWLAATHDQVQEVRNFLNPFAVHTWSPFNPARMVRERPWRPDRPAHDLARILRQAPEEPCQE